MTHNPVAGGMRDRPRGSAPRLLPSQSPSGKELNRLNRV